MVQYSLYDQTRTFIKRCDRLHEAKKESQRMVRGGEFSQVFVTDHKGRQVYTFYKTELSFYEHPSAYSKYLAASGD